MKFREIEPVEPHWYCKAEMLDDNGRLVKRGSDGHYFWNSGRSGVTKDFSCVYCNLSGWKEYEI